MGYLPEVRGIGGPREMERLDREGFSEIPEEAWSLTSRDARRQSPVRRAEPSLRRSHAEDVLMDCTHEDKLGL